MALMIVVCCGTTKEKCDQLLRFHVGVNEHGISHGFCRKHELQMRRDWDVATAAEILELEEIRGNQ